jgi:putative phosphoesterase
MGIDLLISITLISVYVICFGDDSVEAMDVSAELDGVAVITDIHGNLRALEAALARIEELGIERVFCGGDLVGYGPHPSEVCALIAQRGIPTIYGNYDYAIARDLEDCGCAYVTPHDRGLGQHSVAWTLAHTSREAKELMRELPFDLRFRVGEIGVHLVHGSPRKVNEYLFEDKPARLYERLASAESDPLLVFGHTHKPWVHEYGGVLFVNCGSVGKPKDGDPRGAFAVLRPSANSVAVSIERVDYDAAAEAAEVRDVGLPGELADTLLTGT